MEFYEKTSPIQFENDLCEREESIHSLAVARSKRYLLAEADLLDSIIEIDRHRVYEAFHYTHLTPYCVQELGLSEDVAAAFIRVARKSREVPQLSEAVREGNISLTKAKTIVSVLTAENQEDWISKAGKLSKYDLEKKVSEANPKAAKPEKAKAVGEQRVRVEFELTEAEMELFRRAQELTRSATLAETQRKLLEFFLAKKDPVQKAERSRDRSSPRPAVHRRDKGACQAKLPNGKICGSKKWVELHHIHPRAEGGPNTVENLITLCGAHHRQWHRRI